MATERLSMRQIREILRQRWALGLSHRAVAGSLRVGLGTISSVVSRAQAAGLDWAQVQTLADETLEGRLYGRPEVAGQQQRPAPDCAWIHAERRRPGVTLELLHLELPGARPRRLPVHPVLRPLPPLARAPAPVHAPAPPRRRHVLPGGYAGQKPRLIDPTTGETSRSSSSSPSSAPRTTPTPRQPAPSRCPS